MTKFNKKLRKITLKNPRYAVSLGSAFGHLDEITDLFRTVFVLDYNDDNLKKRNIVYMESFKYLTTIPDVDVIFVDEDKRNRIQELQPIWRRYNSFLIVQGEPFADKFLRNERYKIIVVEKKYHVWKIT
jgi:hypothetical protein